MKGKTVKTVKFGIGEHHKKLHQSDVLLLEFTDGSILSIQTGSNTQEIVCMYCHRKLGPPSKETSVVHTRI